MPAAEYTYSHPEGTGHADSPFKSVVRRHRLRLVSSRKRGVHRYDTSGNLRTAMVTLLLLPIGASPQWIVGTPDKYEAEELFRWCAGEARGVRLARSRRC